MQRQLEEYRDLLTAQDLMKIFRVSKTTVYKEIGNMKFGNPIRIGREFKFPKQRIINMLQTDN